VPAVLGVPVKVAYPPDVVTFTVPAEVKPEKFIPGGKTPVTTQHLGAESAPATVKTTPVDATPAVAVNVAGVVTIPEAPTSVCTEPIEAAAINADLRIDAAGNDGTASSPRDIRLSTGVFCKRNTRNVTGRFNQGNRERKSLNNLNMVKLTDKLFSI